MKCPRDGTTLAAVTIASIELDKCHQCEGIWFDRGEMDQLRDAKLSEVEEVLEERYGHPSHEPGKTEGYMLCPRCEDKRLQQISYTYMHPDRPVRIDRCEGCFGVWLDKGELDAIVGEKKEVDDIEPHWRLRTLLRSFGKAFGQ